MFNSQVCFLYIGKSDDCLEAHLMLKVDDRWLLCTKVLKGFFCSDFAVIVVQVILT